MMPRISVVLIRPKYPFNIGATARAMDNMGIRRLVIVASQTDINNHAREGAASSQAILASRIEYSSLNEYLDKEPEDVRVGFTRRSGSDRPVSQWDHFLKDTWINSSHFLNRDLALVFGCEDDGLSSEELDPLNFYCQLPTFGNNGSFNLSQAVLIALYIYNYQLQMATRPIHQVPSEITLSEIADSKLKKEFEAIYQNDIFEKWLTTLGFNFTQSQNLTIAKKIKRLILRAAPTSEETRLLSSIIYQSIRKLSEYNSLRSQTKNRDSNHEI